MLVHALSATHKKRGLDLRGTPGKRTWNTAWTRRPQGQIIILKLIRFEFQSRQEVSVQQYVRRLPVALYTEWMVNERCDGRRSPDGTNPYLFNPTKLGEHFARNR